ncbi:MAG: hypothetical protein ACOC3V_00405 [bacterium]
MKPVEKIFCTVIEKKEDYKEYLKIYLKNTPATVNEDNSLQCVSGKTRSVDMLYNLVIGLYPDVEFEDFIKTISELTKEFNACLIQCGDTKKITFYKESPANFFNIFKEDGEDWSEAGLVKPSNNDTLYTVFGKYTIYDLYDIINK